MKPLMMLMILTCGVFAEDGVKADAAAPDWVNVSAAFMEEIGANSPKTEYERRCMGMIVTPNGDILIQTLTKGVCRSNDQGATWAVIDGNKITGRCETGHGFSIPYPYDGRMAFFCCDGTGGISLDDGKTWRPFTKVRRMFELADADWSQNDLQVVLGVTHEPFFTELSEDGGKTWREISKDVENGKELSFHLGVIDAKTFVRAPARHAGLELSTDGGQTWTRVGDFRVTGRRPVHYGKNVYWPTSVGVIVSSDGKDWSVTGPGAENAVYGPYFGASEQEFMVVTRKSFLATADGGKTWRTLAPTFLAPDGFRPQFPIYAYYGWDPKRGILYTSGLGGSVYRLQLK